MLEEIIEKYCSNALFIDIDSIEQYLSELSIVNRNILLMEIYDYNNKIYKKLEKQNKEYLKLLNSNKENSASKISKIKQVKDKLYLEDVNSKNQELKLDISFYMACIENIENLFEIDEILPDKSNVDYVDIINSILIKLIEERVIIQRLIKEMDQNDPDNAYYVEELEKVIKKINYIKNYNARISLPKENVIKKQNHVIFLTTNMDNNCFMNDLLKNVDEHYYEYVKELLESIKNGSFKNVKAFTENNLLSGICEVKLSQLRILFRRIKPGVYIVIQVLVKKFQTGHHYHSMMIARNSLYNQNEEDILSKINDQDYLDNNEKIYNGIINYLDISKKGGYNGKVNRKNK